MHFKNYSAQISFDDEDEIFVGKLAGISDTITFHATTVNDLREAFHEAVDDYLATCAKLGKSPQKTFSGRLMLRVDPAVHAKAAMAAELAGKSLNQWSEEVLDKAAQERAA
jgi:predicted HicB family RNase H-like nuclease